MENKTRKETIIDPTDNECVSSLCALAEKHGLKDYTLRARLSYGWSLERALTTEKPKRKRGAIVDPTDNKLVSSFSALAKKHGLKRVTILARLRYGWSLEKALETKKNGSQKVAPIDPIDGEEFTSFVDLANKHGKEVTLVRDRLKLGWTLEEALTKEVGENSRVTIVDPTDNEVLSSIAALAKKHNMFPETLRYRLRNGWELEKALTTPITKKRK